MNDFFSNKIPADFTSPISGKNPEVRGRWTYHKTKDSNEYTVLYVEHTPQTVRQKNFAKALQIIDKELSQALSSYTTEHGNEHQRVLTGDQAAELLEKSIYFQNHTRLRKYSMKK